MTLRQIVAVGASVAVAAALPWAWPAGAESGQTNSLLGAANITGVSATNISSPRGASNTPRARYIPAEMRGLEPRERNRHVPDEMLRLQPGDTGRLFVKFEDSAMVRHRQDVGAPAMVESLTGEDLNEFFRIVNRHSITVERGFSAPDEKLNALRMQSEMRSGREQADLAGVVRLDGPPQVMEQVARQLMNLPVVEFVEFEAHWEPAELENPHLAEQLRQNRDRRDLIQAVQENRNLRDFPNQRLAIEQQMRQAGQEDEFPFFLRLSGLERRGQLLEIADANHAHQRDVQIAANESVDDRLAPAVGEFVNVTFDTGWVGVADDPEELDPAEALDADRDRGRAARTTDREQLAEPEVVFSDVIAVADAAWMRLYFGDVSLGGSHRHGTGTIIRLTSLRDGAQQHLDAMHLINWGFTSAYFNGGAVMVELLAYPGTGVSRITIPEVVVGNIGGGQQLTGGLTQSICDGTDDRTQATVHSFDGRLLPAGCTGFTFNGEDHAMLTAGHCVGGGLGVAQFNIPDSTCDGQIQMPGPEDQYPVDGSSIAWQNLPSESDPTGCSVDWAVFGVFINSETGLSPSWAEGATYTLATSIPGVANQPIRIRGYGTNELPGTPLPPGQGCPAGDPDLSWNQTLTEDTGPFVITFAGTGLGYRADTTGGTSGSAVFDVNNDDVIGIHTCGGCGPAGSGFNIGTAITKLNLQTAINTPIGVRDTGACCFMDVDFDGNEFDACEQMSQVECIADNEGTWLGPGIICDAPEDAEVCDEDLECGSPLVGSCVDHLNNSPYCDIEECCEFVCDFDEFCCNDNIIWPGAYRGSGNWDQFCSHHAHRIPQAGCPGPPPPCFVATGACDQENPTAGCDVPGCCKAVCTVLPTCCEFGWKEGCADLANMICNLDGFDPDAPTPDFRFLQGYLTVESYLERLGYIPPQIAVATINLYQSFFPDVLTGDGWPYPSWNNRTHLPLPGWFGEGYDFEGMYQFAEFLKNNCEPETMHCTPENMSRGESIRIGMFFHTAFVDPDPEMTHEALRDRVVYAEPDQTQMLFPNSLTGHLNGHHGTAVLGILAGREDGSAPFWDDNSVGETGIVGVSPDSDVFFFPAASFEEGGRLQNAMVSAMEMFEPGDVFVLPYVTRTGAAWRTSPLINSLVGVATGMGITTVMAAGDTDTPVSAGPEGLNEITVGAVTPGWPYFKAGFSNWCEGPLCPNEEAVHVSGWGYAVTTAGYGDLFIGNDESGNPTNLRSYTTFFGGTGAATAQVAGLVANLQGLSKQFYGIPLTPQQIRSKVAGHGICQGGDEYCIGGANPIGFDGPTQSYGNWTLGGDSRLVGSVSWTDPQSGFGLAARAVFTDLPLAAEWLTIAGFFDDCDILNNIYVVTGELLFGNVFSACPLDGNPLRMRSKFINAGDGPTNSVPIEVPLDQVAYVASGQVIDVLADVTAPSNIVSSMSVETAGFPVGFLTVSFIELYDWEAGQWMLLNAEVHPPGSPIVTVTDAFAPSRFIRNQDQQVFARYWILGFTTSPSPGSDPTQVPFEFDLDLFTINFEGVVDQ